MFIPGWTTELTTTRNGIRSSAWSVLEYVWSPLLLFVTTPYFLHTLGKVQYGHWVLLNATVSFGAILNVGTGPATIRFVSEGLGRNDRTAIDHAIRAAFTVALVGGTALSALILGFYSLAGDAVFARMGNPALLKLTGVFAALLAWLEQLQHVFSSALKGAEHFQRAAWIEMTSRTLQVAGAAVAVALTRDLLAVYLVLTVVGLFRLSAKALVAKRVLGFATIRPVWRGLSDVLYFSKWGWVQGVGGLLTVIADRMIVAAYLGATDLVSYSVAVQLTQQIHLVPAAAFSVLFPMISRRYGQAGFSLRRIAKATVAWNIAGSSALAVGLILFGHKVLSIWIGDASGAAEILVYLSISYWLLSITVSSHYLLLGVGRVRFVAIGNLLAGIITFVALSLLVPERGLVGVGFARSTYGIVCLVNLIGVAQVVRGSERRHE